jgi:hypothetical protein
MVHNQTEQSLKSARKFQASSRGTLNTCVAPSIVWSNFLSSFYFFEDVTRRVDAAQICSSLAANDPKNKIFI